jgi:hypothetical protein
MPLTLLVDVHARAAAGGAGLLAVLDAAQAGQAGVAAPVGLGSQDSKKRRRLAPMK